MLYATVGKFTVLSPLTLLICAIGDLSPFRLAFLNCHQSLYHLNRLLLGESGIGA